MEALSGTIFGPFLNVDNFRSEAYNVVVDPTGIKVSAKFCDSNNRVKFGD